jgi:DNA polymerase-1
MPPRSSAVYLVDGNAQFHRAFFAIRGLSTSRGLPTNATYGFTTMLRKLLADERPRFIGVAFDPPGRTFRHERFAEYKANRPRMADDLAVQIPYVRRVCEVLRLPMFEVPGWEADDVIATLARQAVAAGHEVVVVSADKDLLQLVNERVSVLNPGREGSGATHFDRQGVIDKFGVPPEQVIDVLALVGDAVDNVPGVPGIGDKGARDLVREYGALENVLAHAEQVPRKAYREGLLAHAGDARLSKELVTLRADAPVTLDLERLAAREPDRAAARALFVELEFAALAKEFAPEASAAATFTPRVLADEAALVEALSSAREAGRLAVVPLVTSREPMRAALLGLGLSWAPGQGCYLPLEPVQTLLGEPRLPAARALALLRPVLEDARLARASPDSKRETVLLGQRGLAVAPAEFDALLAAYLLNPGRRAYTLEDLARETTGEERPARPDVVPADAEEGACARAAAGDAELLLRLSEPLSERLREDGLWPIYADLERPLVAVLADMEQAGVKLDVDLLRGMGRDLDRQLEALTRAVHALAGGEFNINSPAQLREVLFERLGLRAGKKTAKTRASSTAEDVLEELAQEHELPRRILDYRGVQKLKSTYVDALPALVHPRTGRVHALLNQTVAATGRISSSDPNLQNIPIRTAEGRRIREAFVAEPGHLLLSADYSQIELRVLAHLSGDERLIDTFRRGEDVHERTAREVFGPFASLSADEQRRFAKMINYALLYGKTAFTLAKDLGVSKREAEEFIAAYFARYPTLRAFIDETLRVARETGLVRTLLGRLRRLPDLNARNFQVRAEAERQAMNTPVQGSAADLIKKAMLELHAALRRRGGGARLILQIHDELLLEVPEGEAEDVRRLVVEIMQGALALDVPLVVDARIGRNWAAAH